MQALIGHTKHLEYFQKLVLNQKLHHAYALVGASSLGKNILAKHIIADILHTTVEKLPIHPDFLQVERIDEDGNVKRDITVEHIEQVTSKVSRSPIAGSYNVILIDDAEKMNSYAANALLKTLEEPLTPTVFFLLTTNEKKLLPTIESRVHTIQLSRVRSQELLEELKKHFPDEKNLEEIVSLAHGLPGRAIKWIEQRETFDQYKKETEKFFALFGKPLYEKLALVESLFGDKKAHIEGRQELVQILRIWEECIETSVEEKNFPQLSSGVVVPLCDIIESTIAGLGQNVHPRLLVENLLLRIP